MRKLLYAPLMHDPSADMGDWYLKNARMLNLPLNKMTERGRDYVAEIEKNLSRYEIDKVYMDTQSDSGEKAAKFYRRTAREGSPTFKLLKSIVDNGARPMKTESWPILEKYFKLDNAALADFSLMVELKKKNDREGLKALEKIAERHLAAKHALEKERNNYIAKRIDRTLYDGEIAAFFMGALHSIRFPRSIDVEYMTDLRKMKSRINREFFSKSKVTKMVKYALKNG